MLTAIRLSREKLSAIYASPMDRTMETAGFLAAPHGVTVVQPGHEPADMKESVLLGLAYLRAARAPADSDVWLVAPADMPGLTPAVINAVIEAAPQVPAAIVVPTWGGRRGHPVRLAWPLAAELETLGSDEGLRDLIARHRVTELPLTDPEICHDVDTPADWEAYRQRSAIERPNARGGESDS